MDIIKRSLMMDEYLVIYRIETDSVVRSYIQYGTHINFKIYQNHFKKKKNLYLNIYINVEGIEYFQYIFEKYSKQMENRLLRTEVKLYIEQGYKLIKNGASEIYINIRRYSINFAVWSLNNVRYDRGFGFTNDSSPLNFLEDEFEALYKTALDESSQIQSNTGFYNVILDPEATGLFVHEVVGHCMESDIILANENVKSIFKTNRIIASPIVTIEDNPTIPTAFGSYEYDDEGTKARNVQLISNGRVNEYMNSLKTADTFNVSPNGHSRSVSYKFQPIVRMSNTYMKSGITDVKDLFDSIDYGIYLKGAGNSKGGLNFNIKYPECYLIKNGKITQRISSVRMFGNVEQTLWNIEYVANDFKLLGGGEGGCGKMGQWPLPVSSGGPHIKIKNAFIIDC